LREIDAAQREPGGRGERDLASQPEAAHAVRQEMVGPQGPGGDRGQRPDIEEGREAGEKERDADLVGEDEAGSGIGIGNATDRRRRASAGACVSEGRHGMNLDGLRNPNAAGLNRFRACASIRRIR
jgi:hypothetical protein